MTTGRGPNPALPLALAALLALGCGEAEDPPESADVRADTPSAQAQPAAEPNAVTVADVGFQTPESVLHDEVADVYLVSNINGAPLDRDDNGFISRVTPDGEVEELRWIDGAAESIPLSAPKGMGIHGDTLFVTDIDSVRAFHRTSGDYLGARGVPGATFLNDIAVGPDGTLYVSDTGMNAEFSSTGTDAVYRFQAGEPVVVVEGSELAGPNGLAVMDDRVVLVSFGAPQVRTVSAMGGEASVLAELPGASLDGVVVLEDGSMLVSSWETSTVYHVPASADGGEAMAVVEDVPSPADIGWDGRRNRVLIPIFQENRLVIRAIDTDAM